MATSSLLSALEAWQHHKRWLLGYSGGLDSTVLLHQLATLAKHPPLHAVHINHQLSPHADAWQQHAQRVCAQLQIPITVIKVAVPENHGRGLEDAARAARYQAFESVIEEGDVLMLAHHQDDQAETMLLRLLRGAGVRGLAGMPAQREIGLGHLLRPLLAQSKSELVSYANTHQLEYIIDESNDDLTLDRNYLRHNVMPLLETRWPGFARNWAHSGDVLAGTSEALDVLADTDASACGLQRESFGCSLQLGELQTLSRSRAYGVLRHACEQFSVPPLPRNAFNAIMQELIAARADGQPKVSWTGGEARRFDNCVYLLCELPEVCSSADTVWQRSDLDQNLLEATFDGSGRLQVEWLRPPPLGLSVRIGFRQGGEVIRATGRNSKHLKQWFQEQRVPPWLRERTPLLFVQQELIAVGETCVSRSDDWEIKNIRLMRAPY
ncbi:MAG: tRNA lysidine(34) synthetase TilS [Pseudomonadales bacterium]